MWISCILLTDAALVGLGSINADQATGRDRKIHISVGVINFVQWTLLALAPVTQVRFKLPCNTFLSK